MAENNKKYDLLYNFQSKDVKEEFLITLNKMVTALSTYSIEIKAVPANDNNVGKEICAKLKQNPDNCIMVKNVDSELLKPENNKLLPLNKLREVLLNIITENNIDFIIDDEEENEINE